MTLLENIATFFSGTKKPNDQSSIETVNKPLSFTAPNDLEGSLVVEGGKVSYGLDLDTTTTNEIDLIRRYRDAARFPEVSQAIDEIINEIVTEDDVGDLVTLDLTDLEYSEGTKKKIIEEFKEIQNVMQLETKAYDYVRKFYVDGRLYFHKVFDPDKPKLGIQELRYINPTAIKKVVEIIKEKKNGVELIRTSKEYYTYSNKPRAGLSFVNAAPNANNNWSNNQQNQTISVNPDVISYISSGLYDEDFGTVLSFLHPALKTVNQLRTIEDALIIYRLSRAPERRIFYVDVGNLPKAKAEQYLRDLMAKFKTNLSYDALTGEVKDAKRHMNMLEDFWMPRRGDGKATEITTLPGGQNLSNLEDVDYFHKKLMNNMSVPVSRLSSDTPSIAGIGRSSEITREEIKFQKFIDRLRKRISMLLLDILKTQLLLKNIVTKEDWDIIQKSSKVKWSKDSFYLEMKETEILRERLTTLQLAEPYIGKYITKEYVLKTIMRTKEEDFDELVKQLEVDRKEVNARIADDTVAQQPPEQG